MYLSTLLVDTGTNPDRPRPGRLWLRNLYRVHQRLCMAFPSHSRKAEDRSFLKPFKMDEFGEGQIHVRRSPDAGFLFRIDSLPHGRAVIIVLSAIKPDWDYAFHNAQHLLAAPPSQPVEWNPNINAGDRFRFRLLVNPTRKICTIPKKRWEAMTPAEREKETTRHGKRIPVLTEHLVDWLDKRAQLAGFSLDKQTLFVQPGYVYVNKGNKEERKQLRSAFYEGILIVENANRFRETLMRGIGPAKAFGFGLLSITRV